jgi:TorA maturation chaperone TorD
MERDSMEKDGVEQDTAAMLQARRALYGLLSRLFLAPPDAALLSELAELPGFAEALPFAHRSQLRLPDPRPPTPAPQPPTPNPRLDPDPRPPTPDPRLDSLQIAYEHLFGRNVYPYESLYVDRDLMLNTVAADEVARLYAECGFIPSSATGAPDHLGLELGLMAHLLALEVAARAGDDTAALAWARAQQARCLHAHLARWAPVCLRAVERATSDRLYLAVARLTVELILSDLGLLPSPGSPLPAPPSPLLAPDDHGLNHVVRVLLTPDLAGIFLSREDLAALGRRLSLPAPIGERFQMLRGLFESAGRFELVVPLLDALAELLAAEAGAMSALAAEHPAWATIGRGWLERIAQGRALLDELRAQASAEAAGP